MPPGRAQTAAEPASAKDLYLAAEAAMRDGRFEDAIRDYGASYERSHDPALFYKLGRANERAGRCQTALVYYARYLRDGKPSAQFAALTQERMAACGGDPASVAPSALTAGSSADPRATAGHAGNATITPDAGAQGRAPSREAPGDGAQPAEATPPREPTAAPAAAGSAAPAPSAPPTGPGPADSAPPRLIPSTPHKIAWLLGGSTIALVTLGGVLAYATRSAENDVRDLYAGLAGRTPSYDAQTQKRYHELVDEGRRYERLSWTAFGLAGVTAIGAAVLFVIGGAGGDAAGPPARVAPLITARSAGVAVQF